MCINKATGLFFPTNNVFNLHIQSYFMSCCSSTVMFLWCINVARSLVLTLMSGRRSSAQSWKPHLIMHHVGSTHVTLTSSSCFASLRQVLSLWSTLWRNWQPLASWVVYDEEMTPIVLSSKTLNLQYCDMHRGVCRLSDWRVQPGTRSKATYTPYWLPGFFGY